MIGSLGRYTSVLCLSYQSYKASQSMTAHLVDMAASLAQSESLETAGALDQALSEEYAQAALADETEAESLAVTASDLRADSALHKATGEADQLRAEEYERLAAQTETESVATGAKALASQALYNEKSEQALAEVAAASRDEAATESDTIGVGICEVVPLVDVVCDVVGAVAAISLQSEAARLMAQSALDASEASAAKAEEESLLARVEVLEEEAATDEGLAEAATVDMEREEDIAAEEAAEAQQEEETADELLEKSQAEAAMAEETATKAEGEEAGAAGAFETAAEHGVAAFWKAVVSEYNAFLTAIFFGSRILVAFVLPASSAMVGSIGSYAAKFCGYGKAVNSVTIVSSLTSVSREISYFVGHCAVFLSGMTVLGPTFSSILDKRTLNTRQLGGLLLCFAGIAAFAQTLILHTTPLVVSTIRSSYRDEPHLRGAFFVWRVLSTILEGMLYLVPLYVMELCELRLLSKSFFFATGFSTLCTTSVGLLLFVICLTLAVNDATADDESSDNHDSNWTKTTSCEVEVIVEDWEATTESSNLLNDRCREEYGCSSVSIEVNGTKAEQLVSPKQPSSPNRPRWRCWINQYIADLKLPFEILVTTCMIVNLQACVPMFVRLLPQILQVHTSASLTLGGLGALVVLLFLLWMLLWSMNDLGHHGGIWMGRVGATQMRRTG